MFLGIDLGTQSVKALLVDGSGKIIRTAQESYPIHRPQPGYAEQHPAQWWAATCNAVQSATRHYADAITAISVVGHMHGFVMIDAQGDVIRPAIIWMDQRSAPQIQELSDNRWLHIAGNALTTGMAAASLAWLKQHEPQNLARTTAILAPKDWIRYKLCGELHSEAGDASALLLMNVQTRSWSTELAGMIDLSMEKLPPLVESSAVVGTLTPQASSELGLKGTPQIVAGTSDQAASLLGSGVIQPEQAALTLGTGGQMSVVSSKVQGVSELNTFCHALPDRWYAMGALLAGAYVLTWWQQIVGRPVERILQEAAAAPPASDGILFRPSLNGERGPALQGSTASFAHLTAAHDARHMSRAVLEGIAFALNDFMTMFKNMHIAPAHMVFGGGGAKSELWGQIIASTLNLPLMRLQGDEQTALGAAMLAAVGTGHFADFDEAAQAWVSVADVIEPVAEWVPIYEEAYARFSTGVTKREP